MNGNHIGIIVVLLIVIAGGWYLLSGTSAKAPVTETPVSNQMPIIGSTTPETTVGNTVPNVTVAYTDQGFSPNSVSISLGTIVTFVNQSSKGMWVASSKHPDHTVYSGTSLSQHCPDASNTAFDQCSTNTSYSFTFNKVGTWKYHNHVNASDFGTIIVTSASASSTTPQLQ